MVDRQGPPIFRGIFEDNDPARRLMNAGQLADVRADALAALGNLDPETYIQVESRPSIVAEAARGPKHAEARVHEEVRHAQLTTHERLIPSQLRG